MLFKMIDKGYSYQIFNKKSLHINVWEALK